MIRAISRKRPCFTLKQRCAYIRISTIRSKSNFTDDVNQNKIKLDASNFAFIAEDAPFPKSSNNSSLPFERRRNSEIFGQLVRSEHLKADNQLVDNFEEFIKPHQINQPLYDSPYRNSDGSFIKGKNAEEARLQDLTLEGRVDHGVAKLPSEIAKAINNNILRLTEPDRLRERVAKIFQSLNAEQIEKSPESALDCDAHVAALFLQDYSHIRQIILELQKRVGKENFNPKKVLDVGYGPGTGMVALNEIMGKDFIPEEKDIYIVGRSNNEMKKRAKIILSRQLNENLMVEEFEEDMPNSSSSSDPLDIQGKLENHQEENAEEQDMEIEDEYVGPVNTSKIKIKSKLRDSLPVTKKYDLIIVNKALLTREHHFPKDIDINIHMILKLLVPGGNLILIQRGNTLGFETIARARQVMIRPESYDNEIGKIPRPYIKGSSLKPQKLRKEDQLISEDDIEFEENLLKTYEEEDLEENLSSGFEKDLDFETELNLKYGKASEEDMKFEFEDNEDFEVIPVSEESKEELGTESVDYHISIIAPCPHHAKCPLQLGDPKYYKIPSHKHRLNFCSFNKVVERPRYTLELKKGKRLATQWDKSAEDGFGLDKLSKNKLNKLQGTGRPGGNNTESGSFSYLIAQRSLNDATTIKKIEEDREYNNLNKIDNTDVNHWPRIIDSPTKIKNNVKLNVCSPSGHIETWQIPKSLGKEVYHDARKVDKGDLWALGKKSVIKKNQLSDKVKNKLDTLAKTHKKSFLKEQRKKQWKKLVSTSEKDFENDIVTMSDALATSLETSKKYKSKGKRARFDVDPATFNGR